MVVNDVSAEACQKVVDEINKGRSAAFFVALPDTIRTSSSIAITLADPCYSANLFFVQLAGRLQQRQDQSLAVEQK